MTTRLLSWCSATRAATFPTTRCRRFSWPCASQGLSGAETFALTDAMIRSGDTIDLHEARLEDFGRQAFRRAG